MSLDPAGRLEQATAFISYAREDKEFVLRLCESLRGRGVEPVGDWLLTAGEDYAERLRNLNLSAQAFVFVISPDSVGSKACREELALAVENRKQVLPVSRRNHGDDNQLDSALRAPHWTFLREGDDYEAGVGTLVKAVNTDFDLMDTHGRLLLAAKEWEENGRNQSYLLRKDGLREAEAWLARTSAQPNKLPQPTPLVSQFILAAQSARSRGARIAFGVTLAVVLSLSALTVWALLSARAARRQEEEARRQQRVAEENERRALEQSKRRLMTATLLLNPEGTKLTTFVSHKVAATRQDLLFGIRPWSLRMGSLRDILKKFYEREPALFVRVFGDGDPALAERFLAYVARPYATNVPLNGQNILWNSDQGACVSGPPGREEDDDGEPAEDSADPAGAKTPRPPEFPDGYLDEEPWVSRFKLAARQCAFQKIQLEEHAAEYLSFVDEVRQFAPQLRSERGVAFMLDMAFELGRRRAKTSFQEALKNAPNQAEAELMRRMAERASEPAPFRARTRRRRELFITTPYLSDNELGY